MQRRKKFDLPSGQYPGIVKRVFLLAAISLLATLSGIGPISHPALAEPLASVNNVELHEADLQDALNEIMPAAVFHGGFSSEKREKYRPQAFEKMIDRELLFQEALKGGLKADEDFFNSHREKAIKRLGGEEQYTEALKKANLTEKQYRRALEKKNLIEQITANEILAKAKVPDQQIKSHYEENKSKFFRPKAVQLRQILISVAPNATAEERAEKKRRAQEVYDKIKAGGDMAKLAWDYSDDAYRVKGGDYGLIHEGRLDPELENQILPLEVNQLSGILATRFGFHIARIEAVVPPTQLTLEDVQEMIRKDLSNRNEAQLREKLIQRLRAEAKIERF